jgi:hypothetical protein
MKKAQLKCKHKRLTQCDDSQTTAKCDACGYVFGKNEEYELFNLTDNEYYDMRIVYIRKPGVRDEDIKESFEYGIAPL